MSKNGRLMEQKQGNKDAIKLWNLHKSRAKITLRGNKVICFCCFVFFSLRLLRWWSECHHSVCSMFPAGQRQRRLPWNNGEPLPVSVTLSWLMFNFYRPFTSSAYFTQPHFLIFYRPSIHWSNFIKEYTQVVIMMNRNIDDSIVIISLFC